MVRAVEPKEFKRVAVIAGLRTPFAKQNTSFRKESALSLGQMVCRELIERAELSKQEIDAVIYGQVLPSLVAPNIAREIILGLPWPSSIDAHSVSRACATSTQAVATASMMIETGQAKVIIAGGADSASDVPISVSKPLASALVAASTLKTPMDKIKSFAHLSAKDLLPVPPAPREYSTGLTMGESAEKMAKENHISREAQDAFAHRSHTKAAKAWADGIFQQEVMPCRIPPSYQAVIEDNLVRKDSTIEGYAKLRPAFDKAHGTITAGTSSALTDGASAVLLMDADVAKGLGYKPIAYIKSFAFAALSPNEQMLMGPAYAIPRVLDAMKMQLRDVNIVDIHEAFAAQVLSNLQALSSSEFAKSKLGKSSAVGEIEDAKLNIYGGSIALGHPFAATGTRQLLTVACELQRRGGGTGLIAQCAAGGLGAALMLEA